MKKVLNIIACACLLAAPGLGWTLGLGEIDVQSKLNETLRAEIRLLYSDVSEPQSTTVALASAQDFERVGLDLALIPTPLSFSVVQNDSGNYVILVTSEFAIDEPFLDFLIEVNWANGRLLREYVVLLDPPVVAPSVGPAQVTPLNDEPVVSTPRVDDTEPRPIATAGSELPIAQPPTTVEPSVTEPTPQATPTRVDSDGTYGPVVAGDTLWDIARDWRPSDDVTINQMMILMFRMNPQAFYEDNINALRQGAILRLPDEFASLPANEALSLVRTQNEIWDSYRQIAATRTATVSDAGTSADYDTGVDRQAGSGTDSESRLELVPASGDSSSDLDRPGEGVQQLREQVVDLREDLSRSREDLISSEQENTELRSRLEELEDLVGNYERAISLKDADLADLQRQLEMAREASDGLAADVLLADGAGTVPDLSGGDAATDRGATDANSGSTVISDGNLATDSGPAPSLADDAATVEPQASVSVPTVTTPPRSPRPSLMEQVKSYATNPYLLGGVGGLIVLAVVAVMWSRRRSADSGGSMVDDMMLDSDDRDQGLVDEIEAVTSAGFDVDEDELAAAIAASPTDPQAHLALLRRYYADGEQERFIEAATQMLDNIGGDTHPAWMEVRAMGANLAPDHHLFASTAEDDVSVAGEDGAFEIDRAGMAAPSLELDEEDDLDLSLDLDDIATGDADLSMDFDGDADGLAQDTHTDGDFSLDFDLPESDTASATPPSEASADDDLSLDFDMDDTAALAEPQPKGSAASVADDDLSLDFDLDTAEQSDAGGEELSLDMGIGGDELSAQAGADDGLDFDLDGLELNLGDSPEPEVAKQKSQDEPTEFELEAITDSDLDAGSDDDELDLGSPNRDADTASLAELEAADDDLGDLGLDDLDLGDTDMLGEEDSVGTKLDLAKAYLDMGDPEGARGMLEEVMSEGNPAQKEEAEKLIEGIGS